MAEGGHNPGEPPLKELEEWERKKTEEQKWNPDIQVDVKGSEKSTIGTSTAIGLVYGDVGVKYSDRGRKADRGQNPDKPPPKKQSNESTVHRQRPKINATARGPTYSTVGTSLVIGHVSGDVTYQHDHQRDLLESTRTKISVRTKGMIHVSTVDLLVGKLKSGNTWITITGNPGDGKTTLGHFVLKEFVDKMNVYVIETPEQYHQISVIEEDRVILLNDIFGAFTFDSPSVNKWKDVVTDIFDIQMGRSDIVTKVVFVSRKPILQEVKDHLERYGQMITDEHNLFDVSQFKKEAERLQILECHLERKGITIPDRDKRRVANMDTAHGFPHCCEMYAELVSKEHINIGVVDFFKSPLKFLDITTKMLFQNGYRELFITLVKNDGKFSSDSVEDDNKRWTLKEKAKLQEGSYLANYEGCWVFRHPSIYESVLSVVAEKDPLLFVRYASKLVLQQKMRIKTSESDITPCYILLEPQPCVLDALIERLVEFLQKGDYHMVFQHSLRRNEEFCETLISKYMQKNEIPQDDMPLMGVWHFHCQSMLSSVPMTVEMLRHLTQITTHQDADLRLTSGGYRYIKYPESLRTSTIHLTNVACSAIALAEKNMDQIRIYTGQVQDHVKSTFKILIQGTKREIVRVLKHHHEILEKTVSQCELNAKEVEEKFVFVVDLIKELQEACYVTNCEYEKKIKQTNVKLDRINYKEKAKLMGKCLGAFEEIRQQWRNIVRFFTILSLIHIPLEKVTSKSFTFLATERNASLVWSDIMIDIIYTNIARSHRNAFVTSDILEMYLTISKEHLTVPLTQLGKLLALDPKKDAGLIEEKQKELTRVCVEATRQVGDFINRRVEER